MANEPKEQPGPEVRKHAPTERREHRQEHSQTTDSPRWNEPGSSERERGYPPEGGEKKAPDAPRP